MEIITVLIGFYYWRLVTFSLSKCNLVKSLNDSKVFCIFILLSLQFILSEKLLVRRRNFRLIFFTPLLFGKINFKIYIILLNLSVYKICSDRLWTKWNDIRVLTAMEDLVFFKLMLKELADGIYLLSFLNFKTQNR